MDNMAPLSEELSTRSAQTAKFVSHSMSALCWLGPWRIHPSQEFIATDPISLLRSSSTVSILGRWPDAISTDSPGP